MEQLFKHPKTKRDNVRKQNHVVRDAVLIGNWEEIEKVDARTIRPELDAEILDGLIIKGYEMKWGETNENGEQYDKGAFDDFIQRYFVDGKLNMPVDVNHGGTANWRDYCGRVLYIETNSVGFYFVVYIPRTYADYDRLLWGLKNGIIQGFSKDGFVDHDDYDYKFNEDGTFAYELIRKMSVISVSLVATPANGLPFEQMKQTQNALKFAHKENQKQGKTIAELFSNKK